VNGEGPRADNIGGGAPGRPEETSNDRLDRNFSELLQELRVAQTGVQILFAFLLTIPFAAGFAHISHLDKVAYGVTLVATAMAAALLIAPVSYHRLAFRQGRKGELVRAASVLAECGTICLVIAIAGAIFVVMDVVASTTVATAAAIVIGLFYCALWYVLPLSRRRS
jgi:Family of unknown function (DUF6328)